MTAAEIMDIISRLPGCDGQAADAVSAYTKVEMEDAHKLLKIPKSECPDIWIRLPRHKMDKIMGPVWKTQSFFLNRICTVILWQDYCGKGNLRKFCCSVVGKKFQIGNAYSYVVKKKSSCLCVWMTSNWLEWNKILIRCGKYSKKKSIWEKQHFSLNMYIWDVIKDSVK